MPTTIEAGERYELALVFTDDAAAVAGFQIIIEGDGATAGRLDTRDQTTEIATLGNQLRTIAPKALLAGRVIWKFQWQAPSRLDSDVRMYVAVSAANDDGSPFGDVVHYRQLLLKAR